MASNRKSKGKVSLMLREEMEADEKVFASLSEDDGKLLLDGLVQAFKLTEKKGTSAILVALLADDTYLSEVDSEELYGVVVAHGGAVVHSFATTIFIATKDGHNITFMIVGGANSIAASAQFMTVSQNAALKKAAPAPAPAKRGKKKAPAPAPAPPRRSNHAKKAPVSDAVTPAPNKRSGKKVVVMVDDTPSPEITRRLTADAGKTPPTLISPLMPLLPWPSARILTVIVMAPMSSTTTWVSRRKAPS